MTLSARTLVISGLGAALVAGLAFTAFRTDPVAVDLAPLARGPLSVTVDADGKTRIREVYEVAAPIAGTVLRSPVDVGDPVVAGETLVAIVEPASPALLDARSRAELQAALHEAEAAVRFAEAEVARTSAQESYARTEFERVQKLVESGTAALTRLETASEALDIAQTVSTSAQAQLEKSRAGLDRARAALEDPATDGNGACCRSLFAPADGIVLSVENASERPVQPGQPLLQIGDPRDLEIVVELLSSDATRLAPARPPWSNAGAATTR